MYKFQILDSDDNILWCGDGRKEARTAFKEACAAVKHNFIRLQELKKGLYVTVTGTCT